MIFLFALVAVLAFATGFVVATVYQDRFDRRCNDVDLTYTSRGER